MSYKIIGKYIKKLNFQIPSPKTFFLLAKDISNYKINIDIKSEQLKERIIEVQTTLNLLPIEVDLEKHKFPKLGEPVSYNYLLSLPIYNLTYEKIEELKKQEKDKQSEYDTLSSLSSSDIWKTELQELLELL